MRGAALARRILRLAARSALVLSLVLAALVLLVVTGANLPWTRAWLAREASELVSRQIAGTLEIRELGRVGFASVAGVDAELNDTSGHRVLAVSGLAVELDVWRAARSWLRGAPLQLALTRVTADTLSADLHEDDEGQLALARALGSNAPDTEPAAGGAPLHLALEALQVRRIEVQNLPEPLAPSQLELRGLEARARLDGNGLHFELGGVQTEARALPVVGTLSGELQGIGTLPLDGESEEQLQLNAGWRGQLAEIPIESALVLAGSSLSGFVRARAPARAVRQLWTEGNGAGSESAEPVAVLLAFEGSLHELALRARLESDGGELTLAGRVDLEQLSGRATVSGAALDLSTWLPAAPATALGFMATLHFEQRRGTLIGGVELRSSAGRIARWPLPPLALSAQLQARSLEAQLTTELPGARAWLELELPRGAAQGPLRVPIELRARVTQLSRALSALELRAPELSGRGTLRARATLELGARPRLSAGHLQAELHGLRASELRAAHTIVQLSAQGPLTRPRLSLSLQSRRVSLPHYPLERLRVQAEGTPDLLRLRARLDPVATAPVRLAARLSPAAALLSRLELSAGTGRDEIRASARAVRSTPRGFAIEDLVVRAGAGRLELAGNLRGSSVRVRARSASFSAAALARGLGLDLELPEGSADLSLQLDYRGGRASGTLSGSVTQLSVGPLSDGTLRLDLAAKHGVLQGLAGLAAPLGEVLLRAQAVELPRRWALAELATFDGELELLLSADLAELSRSLHTATSAGAVLGGGVQGRLTLRGDGRTPLRARLALATRGLLWSPAEGGASPAPAGTELVRSSWQDVDVELRLDLADARLRAEAALLDSERRAIAQLRGSAPLPLARLLREPSRFEPSTLPLHVELQVPERRLGDFPAPLRFSGVNGTVRGSASARGVLGRPELAAHVELNGLSLENGRSVPLRVVADARLLQDQLQASAAIRDEHRKLVSLQASATVGSGAAATWQDVAMDLRSNGLPLGALGALLGQDLTGELYGSLELRTNAGKPAAEGTLWVNSPSYRGFRQERARWQLLAGPDSFSTELRLEQRGGHARLTLGGPWRWRAAAVPRVESKRVRAELQAENFELRALASLLPEQARGLAGQLDAQLALDPEREASGSAKVRDGRIYVAALGQEFRDIALDARLGGAGELAIERLSARALNGRFSARGVAELDGLALREAALHLDIPRGDPLPVMLEGVTVATVWGRVDVAATNEARGADRSLLAVQVDVPRLQVVLPQLSPRGVQDLADEPTIETGTMAADGRFVSLPLPPYESSLPAPESEPMPVHVQVTLGDEVWVEQEPMLELKVVGTVQLRLRQELSVQGQLQLARGTIDVQGRTFQLERGEITFLPSREPSNPTVVATGVYTAPEGTRVYAEFVGPVETGKLSLRSEPPLRDDQILSLLLFGTTDGSFGAAATNTGPSDPLGTVGGTALVAGGNALARGLNVELRRLTSLDIQTRIGEREGQPQPEVAVQLTPRLTAELAYRLEAPTPGRAPDRTYLSLDLRLLRNWFLSTTLGDAGSFVLDLVWRYRY